MKILGHIHTFNDDEVIDESLKSLQDQTQPLDEIIIVDNCSTDSTLEREFPPQVTIIRHNENLGTNGTVITGLKYALEKEFDWIWVFDADSAAHKDALKKLLDLYNGFPSETQKKLAFLACLPLDKKDLKPHHGACFTSKNIFRVRPLPGQLYYECNVTIWSGILFRMEAIKEIGLPSPDFVLDWGEFEFCYRIKNKGYKGLIHQESILYHNIGVEGPSLGHNEYRTGPFLIKTLKFPPIRCYYMVRNRIYFWIYQFKPRRFTTVVRKVFGVIWFTSKFFILPLGNKKQIIAIFRGFKDGFTKNIQNRF